MMKILACDIGSTNLKLQVFAVGGDLSRPYPVGNARIIRHEQRWLRADSPLEALADWLCKISDLIIQDYADVVDRIGFSTFREGLVGLSREEEVIFVGTNTQKSAVGELAKCFTVTTLAGWMCWVLTGQHCLTNGQLSAGEMYLDSIALATSHWAPVRMPGERMPTGHLFDVYMGGTDEQLGYLGAGLLDLDGPKLAIATGTYWSVSSLAMGDTGKNGVRRVECAMPTATIDSCILYRWGHLVQDLSNGSNASCDDACVPDEFFGSAALRGFSSNAIVSELRNNMIADLRAAHKVLTPSLQGGAIVVYGGGSQVEYGRDLIKDAYPRFNVVFMRHDATLLGCARVGFF